MLKDEGISVALPVTGGAEVAPLLEVAARCILKQTHRELDVMIVLNGASPDLHAMARQIAFRDSRVRLLERGEANLAAALNLALGEARFELVARMDSDDWCPPDRLARQAEFLRARPGLAGVGCAWELAEAASGEGGKRGKGGQDRVITVVRPPREAGALRWRLLLGNCLAHGSMMLQRSAVMAAGGYDETCARAQDYELWLRLSAGAGLACVDEVLYRHRVRFAGDPGKSTGEQARVVAPLMLGAWRGLAEVGEGEEGALRGAIVDAISREGGPGVSITSIEEVLAERPSKEALLAWLWAQWHHPPMHRRAAEVCRLARVREMGAALKAAGVRVVRLWGAGDHTRWLLEHRDALGVEVAGLVDDRAEGERWGLKIVRPDDVEVGEHVVISSDWHEEAIWEASAGVRGRGVRVWRIYG